MLTVGDKFPVFSKTAVLGNRELETVTSEDHSRTLKTIFR